MKNLLMIVPALLMAAPMQAAVVDPVGYSVTYCQLRGSGTSNQRAIESAINQNIDFTKEATVLPDGIDLDIRLGTLGVKELCPQYL